MALLRDVAVWCGSRLSLGTMIPAVASEAELAQLNWAENWRLQVSKARDERKHELLHGLALRTLKASLGARALAVTGANLIIDDSSLWALSPVPETADVAEES